jgi:hypothetical protein
MAQTGKGEYFESVGLKVEYGELLNEGEDKGTFKTAGDKECMDIDRLLIKENLSMEATGEKLNRSSKTISDHIRFYNRNVKRSGVCPRCKGGIGAYKSEEAERKHLTEKLNISKLFTLLTTHTYAAYRCVLT